MQAEKVSLAEKLEILMFKFVSLFPLVVTFGLYAFLATYYVGVNFWFLFQLSFISCLWWMETLIAKLVYPTLGPIQLKRITLITKQSFYWSFSQSFHLSSLSPLLELYEPTLVEFQKTKSGICRAIVQWWIKVVKMK